MSLRSKSEQAVVLYFKRTKMSASYVKRMLRMEHRPSKKVAFKYVVLRWLKSHGCRFHTVYNGSDVSRRLPPNWRSKSTFKITYKGKTLSLKFSRLPEQISAHLSYRANRIISRSVAEPLDLLPNIEDERLSSDVESSARDEIEYYFNETISSLESEFYGPIMHYLYTYNNETPRSIPSTPNLFDSRQDSPNPA